MVLNKVNDKLYVLSSDNKHQLTITNNRLFNHAASMLTTWKNQELLSAWCASEVLCTSVASSNSCRCMASHLSWFDKLLSVGETWSWACESKCDKCGNCISWLGKHWFLAGVREGVCFHLHQARKTSNHRNKMPHKHSQQTAIALLTQSHLVVQLNFQGVMSSHLHPLVLLCCSKFQSCQLLNVILRVCTTNLTKLVNLMVNGANSG